MLLDRFSLKDKVAIVMGAGRGIGQGIAVGLAEAGADVVITARVLGHLEETGGKVRDTGRQVVAVECDARDGEKVAAVVRQTLEQFGHIDILVNNVGGQFIAPFRKVTEGGWSAIVDLNLKSVFQCSRAVYDIMYRQRQGCVINISSLAASHPSPGSAPYCAAKAGVESLTKVLAVEWGRYNIRVNAISPGPVMTTGAEKIWTDDARREAIVKATPLGRFGAPEDIAAAAVFLASDAARFITGAILSVDGGPVWLDR